MVPASFFRAAAKRSILAIALVLSAGFSAAAQTAGQGVPGLLNDYPTVARADYVFGCMAANGQVRTVLEQCSCSIDIIASILPYEKYVRAETILRMSLVGGENTSMFKSSPDLRHMVDDMRRAQAEAELRCF